LAVTATETMLRASVPTVELTVT